MAARAGRAAGPARLPHCAPRGRAELDEARASLAAAPWATRT